MGVCVINKNELGKSEYPIVNVHAVISFKCGVGSCKVSLRIYCSNSGRLTSLWHFRQVVMSGTHRPKKEAASLSNCKRVRGGVTVPPAPEVPWGQTRHFCIKAVNTIGKTGTKSTPKQNTSGMCASMMKAWQESSPKSCVVFMKST